jgi:hypothetical protein
MKEFVQTTMVGTLKINLIFGKKLLVSWKWHLKKNYTYLPLIELEPFLNWLNKVVK